MNTAYIITYFIFCGVKNSVICCDSVYFYSMVSNAQGLSARDHMRVESKSLKNTSHNINRVLNMMKFVYYGKPKILTSNNGQL